MKKYILLFFLTVLLLPNLAHADRQEAIEIKGVCAALPKLDVTSFLEQS